MARPELCVSALVAEDGRVLLVRRGPGPAGGQWSLPGGRVEAGESLAEAVVREVLEETGLSAVCNHLVGWVEKVGDPGWVILAFAVTLLDPHDSAPRAGSDAAEIRWVSLDQVSELDLTDGLVDLLAGQDLFPGFV
ncbi:MAG: NUDIX hydrolase [Acidimicrobiales bacterium]